MPNSPSVPRVPPEDITRVRTLREGDRANGQRIHTNEECPHLEETKAIEVFEPGEPNPARKTSNRPIPWCSWCENRPVRTGSFRDGSEGVADDR